MSEKNKAVMRRTIEILNAHNLDALEEVIATNLVEHNTPPGQDPGLEGVKQQLSMALAAFPDFQFTLDDLIAEGDKVVARGRMTGTHQGEFMGIPATGKQVSQRGTQIVRIAKGKVVESWMEVDNLGLMQQLGAIPTQG